ncbi:hypothetical protein [Flavobacterium sp. LHD-85]|uniref:hypothetical protein n=1 Tax=Flavobacterium sp. LHD-85 TaxID=3071410 RepID=UPI0027DFF036|nr:hypothetical protein [Flavobacterium sp. LHD-85]MDQ6531934.1 hypothetical protein [Flavobacterium sp. LHD-85]
MKNTTLLLAVLLLFTATIQAKYVKAVLYMEDGTMKKGLAEKVEYNDSKVKFKTSEEAKKEKISSADIKKIEFVDDDNVKFTAERLYATTANLLTGKFSRSGKKRWLYIIYDKSAKIGYITEQGSNRPNAGGTSRVITNGSTSYFFGKKNSEELFFGYAKSAGSDLAIGTDSLIQKMSQEAFADCPKIIEAIEKTDFKVKPAIDQLEAIFDKNKCL